jgi:cell division transport system permease protein
MIGPRRRWSAQQHLSLLGLDDPVARRALPMAGLGSNTIHVWRSTWVGWLATLAAAALTLGLVGTSLSLTTALDRAQSQWSGDVTARVFIMPSATDAEAKSIGQLITASPIVKSASYRDHDAAKREFDQMTIDPKVRTAVRATDLPTSWEVEFSTGSSSDEMRALLDRTKLEPFVYRVMDPTRMVQRIEQVGAGVRWILLSVAALVAVLWLTLAMITARSTATMRRDEFAVMRLVGASRLSIRLPIVLLGVVQGVIAGVIASQMVARSAKFIADWAAPRSTWSALAGPSSLVDVATSTSALLPTIGAAIAVTLAVVASHSLIPRR